MCRHERRTLRVEHAVIHKRLALLIRRHRLGRRFLFGLHRLDRARLLEYDGGLLPVRRQHDCLDNRAELVRRQAARNVIRNSLQRSIVALGDELCVRNLGHDRQVVVSAGGFQKNVVRQTCRLAILARKITHDVLAF